jgi:hypothetical protein
MQVSSCLNKSKMMRITLSNIMTLRSLKHQSSELGSKVKRGSILGTPYSNKLRLKVNLTGNVRFSKRGKIVAGNMISS